MTINDVEFVWEDTFYPTGRPCKQAVFREYNMRVVASPDGNHVFLINKTMPSTIHVESRKGFPDESQAMLAAEDTLRNIIRNRLAVAQLTMNLYGDLNVDQ